MVAGRMSAERFTIESIEGLQEHLAPSPTGAAGGDESLARSQPLLARRDQVIAFPRSSTAPLFAAQGHRRPPHPLPLDERGEDRLTVNPGPLSPVRPGWP